ncbi:MAG: hypothetical protein CVU16_09795 [Betaproteobacteria bacterium HGW-Betaproteobacteria-10]|nr:MAG: hypothetical protein CVU16_09795 [Betaproteobacteria bacterium HGW-Betaproteobacteria-10]
MELKLNEAVQAVLETAKEPLSPSQIRDQIKLRYPYLYQTDAHRIGIEKGNYQNYDHALLNPIYSLVTRSQDFIVDRSQKPMLVSIAPTETPDEIADENFESELGIVYVLSTGLLTEKGQRIIKIGYTTQSLESRISQLYTTGTPFQFKEIHTWKVRNYTELEQALHRLLAPFRLNRAREFFTDNALPFVQTIVDVHIAIQAQS